MASGVHIIDHNGPIYFPIGEIIPWKEEREILQRFESMQWLECKQAVRSVWKRMQEQEEPIVFVKEIADRMDKQFARISGKTPAEHAVWATITTHDELLHGLLSRIGIYSKQRVKHAATDHPEINQIIDYVLGNYDKELTLRSMAKYVNMGEQYLSGLFKKKTGELFIQFVQRIRIEQAKFYLLETDLPVAEIGERVGFVNMNYFFKMFRKWTNVTPSEYRNSYSDRYK